MSDDHAGQRRPLVSLIIPIYQCAQYLPACLESVMSQTYQQFEVLMIDGSSTDGSTSIAKAYVSRDHRFRYFNRERDGVSAARNTGLDEARGDYIGWLDSDDMLLPTAIETLLNAAEENHTAIAMAAYIECHDTKPFAWNRRVGAKACVLRDRAAMQRYFLTDGQFLNHMWTKLFRREVFQGVSFPEGRIYEDIHVMPQLLDNAGSIAIVNKTIYRYQVRSGSITTEVNIHRQMDGITAREHTISYMQAHYPELVPQAYDTMLTICCDLLGRMEHVGVDHVPEEWAKVTGIVRETLPRAAMQNPVFRIAAAAFRKDPRIVSRFVRMLLRADCMI